MTYPETIKYLESFVNYEKIPAYPYKESLKLERIKDFLSLIGNPQDSLRCIHVAGTKGKGSTCAFITYILREAGYRVGLYTSPHLSDFRERIRILDTRHKTQDTRKEFEGMISKKDLIDLTAKLKPTIDKYNKISQYGPLSFFEIYTSLAFVYFKTNKIDFAVLETGLGGRLDATNTVNPLVCTITPISYEHTDKLGKTLKEIATEKAGIIKRHKTQDTRHKLVVVSAPQEEEAREVIADKCREVGAELQEVKDGVYPDFKINLLGKHQLMNANVAIGVIKALGLKGIKIKKEVIEKGLRDTLWPGRCEVVARNPFIVLDGAQNVASAKAIKKTIKESFQYKKLILVLGISSDKDIKGVCRELAGFSDKIILTQANSPRAASIAELKKNVMCHVSCVRCQGTVKGAINLARKQADKKDLILVTGSLFVVGEARECVI